MPTIRAMLAFMPPAPPSSPRSLPSALLWELPTWLLNHVAGSGNRLVLAELGEPGLRTQYTVLAGLAELGPSSQAELVRRIAIDRSDMVALLNRLEAEGLALRAPDPEDGRRNRITITAQGSRALKRLDARIRAAQATLLEPLAPAEREQLIELLQRLLEHHEGYRTDSDR